jgi:hypothetical protein
MKHIINWFRQPGGTPPDDFLGETRSMTPQAAAEVTAAFNRVKEKLPHEIEVVNKLNKDQLPDANGREAIVGEWKTMRPPMKHQFTIAITDRNTGHTVHQATIAAENGEELASYLRKVANVVKDLDFSDSAAQNKQVGIGG